MAAARFAQLCQCSPPTEGLKIRCASRGLIRQAREWRRSPLAGPERPAGVRARHRRCEIFMSHEIDPRWISRNSTEDVIKDHVDDGKMSKEQKARLKKTVAINDQHNDNDELIAGVLKSVYSWWVKASTCHDKTSGAKEKDEGRVRAKEVEECACTFFARWKFTMPKLPMKPH